MTRKLTLTDTVWKTLRMAGIQALPRETGGLLLGYYTEIGPHVTEAHVVPDSRATRIRYRRDAVVADRILGTQLQADNSGVLGYIGEWHTHPLPIGPSATDVHATGRLAAAGGHDITLLVLAMGGRGWSGHALNASPTGSIDRLQLDVKGAGYDG